MTAPRGRGADPPPHGHEGDPLVKGSKIIVPRDLQRELDSYEEVHVRLSRRQKVTTSALPNACVGAAEVGVGVYAVVSSSSATSLGGGLLLPTVLGYSLHALSIALKAAQGHRVKDGRVAGVNGRTVGRVRTASGVLATVALLTTHAAVFGLMLDPVAAEDSSPLRLLMTVTLALVSTETFRRWCGAPNYADGTVPLWAIAVRALWGASVLVLLVAYEWVPALTRQAESRRDGHDARCPNEWLGDPDAPGVDLTSFGVAGGSVGAASTYVATALPAFVASGLVALAVVVGAGRVYYLVQWTGATSTAGAYAAAELVTRACVLPSAAAGVVLAQVFAHVDRMQFDSSHWPSRPCAPFMHRSQQYFASEGIVLAQDCATLPHPYPAHCAACLRGRFGVGTLGEDADAARFVVVSVAAWQIADGLVRLFAEAARRRAVKGY